ncbi:TPA: hypothetical protein J1A13_004790, partial [Escherichia coli]|nr:hypothetical protein [Escherichia coli]
SYRGVHYRYDEFGRTVEKEGRSGTQSYRYDAEHRMVEVTTARGTYRYVYDALGRRTEKQHISPDGKPYNRTTFLWDGMRLAQESRPEGISSLYIYSDPGSYEPLARVDKAGKEGPNRILYFHTDVNGAPEEMTDSDGKIVWETGYQVWGNTIQEKDHGGVEQNLRYQGQYLDRETGLHYNLHRYYDPDVGRFMVTDPIGLAGGLNLYAYAPNPVSWIDPLGLKCGELRNRRQALNKAKDLAGIPRSQQPNRQWTVGNDPRRRGQTNYKYSEDLGSHGRYYEYTDAYGRKKVVVEHTADPRTPGPHAHAGQPKPGADPRTYDFKSDRYQKINDPVTKDHHIYYEN